MLRGQDDLIGTASTNTLQAQYQIAGYPKFLDSEGYPAITPPWGQLSAIDLNKGSIVWQVPFGEYPELAAKGLKNTGSENYGGGIVTAGGLYFIGANELRQKIPRF